MPNEAMIKAIKNRDVAGLKIAFQNGANPNFMRPYILETPLHEAVLGSYPNPEIVKILLQYGANPSQKRFQNGRPIDTPLECFQKTALSQYTSDLTMPPHILCIKRLLTVGWQQVEREEAAKLEVIKREAIRQAAEQEAKRQVELARQQAVIRQQQEATRLAAEARQREIERQQQEAIREVERKIALDKQQEAAKQAFIEEAARQVAAEEAVKQAAIEEEIKQEAIKEAAKQALIEEATRQVAAEEAVKQEAIEEAIRQEAIKEAAKQAPIEEAARSSVTEGETKKTSAYDIEKQATVKIKAVNKNRPPKQTIMHDTKQLINEITLVEKEIALATSRLANEKDLDPITRKGLEKLIKRNQTSLMSLKAKAAGIKNWYIDTTGFYVISHSVKNRPPKQQPINEITLVEKEIALATSRLANEKDLDPITRKGLEKSIKRNQTSLTSLKAQAAGVKNWYIDETGFLHTIPHSVDRSPIMDQTKSRSSGVYSLKDFYSASSKIRHKPSKYMSHFEYQHWVYAQQCAREQGRPYYATPNSGSGGFGFAKSDKQLQREIEMYWRGGRMELSHANNPVSHSREIDTRKPTKSNWNAGTRALGLLQCAGGVAQTGFGVASSFVGGPIIGAGLATIGIDNAVAGCTTAWTGEQQSTLLNQGLRGVGLNPSQADLAEASLNIGPLVVRPLMQQVGFFGQAAIAAKQEATTYVGLRNGNPFASKITFFHTKSNLPGAQQLFQNINPTNPNNRFGIALYLSQNYRTTFVELSYHNAVGKHTIKCIFNQSEAKILDLTQRAISKKWGYTGGNDYATAQRIAEKAKEAGYNMIRFSSERDPSGINIAILKDYDKLLTPQEIISLPNKQPRLGASPW